jgi:hypothetical protein
MEELNVVSVTARRERIMYRPITHEELLRMSELDLLREFLRVVSRPHELTLADVEEINAISHADVLHDMAKA